MATELLRYMIIKTKISEKLEVNNRPTQSVPEQSEEN